MCRVKARVQNGSMSHERVAYIKTAEGTEAEVILGASQAGPNYIVADEVARDEGDTLIELPRETSAGEWRLWVKNSQVMG